MSVKTVKENTLFPDRRLCV